MQHTDLGQPIDIAAVYLILSDRPLSSICCDHSLRYNGLYTGLRWASNMGHLDVFPETSGKAQVARYLLKRLEGDASSSFLLCDDANDMGAHYDIDIETGYPALVYICLRGVGETRACCCRLQSADSRHDCAHLHSLRGLLTCCAPCSSNISWVWLGVTSRFIHGCAFWRQDGIVIH